MTIRTETRLLGSFSHVRISGHGELVVIQLPADSPEQESVVIEADETVLPKIRSEIENDCLKLGHRLDWRDFKYWLQWFFSTDHKIRYTVRLKRFSGITLDGSGYCRADTLHGEACQMGINGSGKTEIKDITAEALEATINGSGEYSLAGKVNSAVFKVNGSGMFRCQELAAQTARVLINGSGQVKAGVEKTLEAEINGSGEIRYFGQPVCSQKVSGSGRISQG